MTNNSRPYVFISYSRADQEFVQRLIGDLQQSNFIIWVDQEQLKPGTRNWEKAIKKGLSESHTTLLIASPDSAESDYVSDEIAYAELEGCSVIPIWAAGDQWHRSVPLGRGRMQYLDMRGEKYQRNVSVLLGQISSTQASSTPQLTDAQPPSDALSLGAPRNPYKGLKAFTTADADDFFGRQDLIDALVSRLVTFPQFLAVVGASGAGKSSVVMAGLLPALRKNAITGSSAWIYLPTVKPSAHPLEGLADALKSQLKDTSMVTLLKDLQANDGLGLHRIVRNLPRADGARVVLFIDQFEEIFTQTSNLASREHFIGLIMSAVKEPNSSLTVIITLRADFSDRPMQYADFGKLMKDHSEPILPITMASLRQVIEEPAKLPDVRLELEPGLASELVFETRGQSGGLPLLQFTLDQLFQMRDGHKLTMAAYQAIGGLNGALRTHAEQTFNALDEESQHIARQLFMRLIEPGATEQDTTRRRAAISEFTTKDATQTALQQTVINTFVNARLLTAEDGTLEVSHEALIREWKRLGDWLREHRKDVALQQELSEAADSWLKRDRPSARLYRGVMLDEALAWTEKNTPSKAEAEFLTASKADQNRQQVTERIRQSQELHLAQEAAVNAQRAQAAERDRAVRFRRTAQTAAAIAAIAIIGVVAAVIGIVAATRQTTNANDQLGTATIAQGDALMTSAAVGLQATLYSLDQSQALTLEPAINQFPPTSNPTLSIDQRLATATQIAVLYNYASSPTFQTVDGVEMVQVPPGCFFMGSSISREERPVTLICFAQPFWIDIYEVTNEQFERLHGIAAEPSTFQRPQQPRQNISWVEAGIFCKQRNARLPTEAEWEYAARGPDSFKYTWGNNFVRQNLVSSAEDHKSVEPADVGSKPSGVSWLDAYDMNGNVWEWTSTILDFNRFPYPYNPNDGREDPSDTSSFRSVKGGSWNEDYNALRLPVRYWVRPYDKADNIGFRCARSS